VIVDFKALGNALHDLFDKHLSGAITTRKVACTIPMSYSFSRPVQLPILESDSDLYEAVQLEAQQYIPIATEELYLDYDVVRKDEKNIDLLLVATPKKIVDSYMKFLDSMGLEPIALEPTMNATARIFGLSDPSHENATVLVDFGANAIDIAVYDKDLFVNNTSQGGSSTMIDAIAEKLHINREEAFAVKNETGMGEYGQQREIAMAVKPTIDNLIHEIRKITRYYDERLAAGGRKVAQVITTGGGANMPGLDEYFSKELGLKARMMDPWHRVDFGKLSPPPDLEKSMFITVAGEAVLDMSEIAND
jgi:type IV pilus assembly protein PilM